MNSQQKLGFVRSISPQAMSIARRDFLGETKTASMWEKLKASKQWQAVKSYRPFAPENMARTSHIMGGVGGAAVGGILGATGAALSGGSAGRGFLAGAGLGTVTGLGASSLSPGSIAKGFIESRLSNHHPTIRPVVSLGYQNADMPRVWDYTKDKLGF